MQIHKKNITIVEPSQVEYLAFDRVSVIMNILNSWLNLWVWDNHPVSQ